MRRLAISLFLALALGVPFGLPPVGIAGSAFAADESESPRSAGITVGGDRYTAGGDLTLSGAIEGDLVGAAGRLASSATVGGDALIAGGELQIGGRVMRDLYAAGGEVRLNARIGRNARIVGGQVELGAQTRVGGNASLAGGELRMLGTIGGALLAAGGSVRIDGTIDGDLRITARSVELGPNARIGGRLLYTSPQEARVDPAASIEGGIERRAVPVEAPEARDFEVDGRLGAAGGVWTLGLVLLAAVLILAFPAFADGVSERIGRAPGTSLLLGFAALAAIPLAVLLLMVTVIGVPLALLLLLGYFALLLLGYVSGAIALGDLVLRRGRAPSRGWRIVASAVVLAVLALLPLVPYVGWVFGPLVMLAGMGAMLGLTNANRRRRLVDRL